MRTPVLLLSFCLLTSYVYAQFTEPPQTILQNEVCEPLRSFATDLDEDGLMDVLVASASDSKVYWYRNVGEQVYERQLLLEDSINRPSTINVIDLEQDGDTDILIGHFRGFSALVNNGDETFTFQAINEEISPTRGFEVIDIDRDGDDDILSTAWTTAIVSLNNGNGQFTHISLPNDLNFRGFKTRIANLDDSPEMEIVLQSASFTPSSSLAIYKYYPENQSLRLQQSISVRVGQQFRLYDHDGDGLIDILFIQSGLNWMKNEGDLNFAESIKIAVSNQVNFTDFTIADHNQDGNMDYFLAELRRGAVGGIQLFAGTDTNSLMPIDNRPGIDQIRGYLSLQVADMDGDQDIDLLVSVEDANDIYWYEFTGERFTERHEIIKPLVRKPFGLSKIDMDADDDLDLIIKPLDDTYISWLPNNMDQGWGDLQRINLDFKPRQIGFADLDNDGKQDAIFAGTKEDGSFFFGYSINQQSLLAQPFQLISTEGILSFAIGDLDSDNDLDIVGFGWRNDDLVWFENDQLNFKRHFIKKENQIRNALRVNDLNNDGFQDIIYATRNFEPCVKLLLNDGQVSLDSSVVITEEIPTILNIEILETKQNNVKDVIVGSGYPAESGGGLLRFSYDSQEGFWDKTVIDESNSVQLDVLDVNDDGNKDLFSLTAAGYENRVLYFLQDSLGQLSKQELGNNPLIFSDFIQIADFNQDGDLDLALLNDDCEHLVYIENQTIVVNKTQEFQNQSNFRIFPNPIIDVLTIETEQAEWIGKAQFQLYNSVGALMKTERLDGFRRQVALNDLPKGIYFYTIRDLSGKGLASGKIVK
ncbi:MAG: hypothetical protein Sapg2KO_52650 [Saprospiraceae bacterium]